MRGQPLLPARRGWGKSGARPGVSRRGRRSLPRSLLLPPDAGGAALTWARCPLAAARSGPDGRAGSAGGCRAPLGCGRGCGSAAATCHKSRGAQPAPAFQASPAPRQLSRPVPAPPGPPQPLTVAGGAARPRRRLPAPRLIVEPSTPVGQPPPASPLPAAGQRRGTARAGAPGRGSLPRVSPLPGATHLRPAPRSPPPAAG